MNKKEFYATIIIYAVLAFALMVTNYFLEYMDWLLAFAIILVGYMYFRYKLTSPMQKFVNKFNMLMDYDLDIESAIEMALNHVENAPTKSLKGIFLLHLGMAYYNNGEYDKAIQTFNQIELQRMNTVYHVLIFAHQAYAYNELGNQEGFDLALERINNVKPKIHKKFYAYATSYERLLTAIKNIEEDPEEYKNVIEAHLSQHNGYISQRLIYHYRMAHYYKVIGDTHEMDIHLAKVLANGKSHFTAKEAQSMFKNSVNIEDYVFTEDDFNEQEPVQEENLDQIQDIEDADVFDQEDENETEK
ncbi:MAG: tol-pal system YbgF family protein [Candidatus Izemoplasmatales bacterium]|uniref:Tetratricopeptide repeat protein n=1 Tax=Hujiaoplasma nucleasis TaxID=2725268 RepID=A0A7L6N588_9MOLU|nr:hypothetical protein [Hujiaoplasma nucleasis]QLY40408.1 hypothetical protein HF295_05910 [Hujiaoplasma nucleasis]